MIRVLVVDDNSIIRESLIDCLVDAGMEVFQAGNGKEALRLLEKQPMDWVLTDIVMPDMDGVELVRELKKRWPNIQNIAWSGADNRDLYLTIAVYLGAKNILQKPVVPSDIIDIIKKNSIEVQR